jgi:GNAT superfamily N-acetyltransferase
MIVKSLGYRTDLMFAKFDGEIIHRDTYVVVRTPSSPRFWWGNFVLFENPPASSDIDLWEETFDREFADLPAVKHRNFAWDTTDGGVANVTPFTEKGYALAQSVFLNASMMRRDSPRNDRVKVRDIAGPREWDRALEVQHSSLSEELDTPTFRDFQTQQMRRYQKMVEAGQGRWFGAFHDDSMVAGMGLFVDEGVGRCQAVATAPSHRRQGVATTLVHHVGETGLDEMGAREIIIITGL